MVEAALDAFITFNPWTLAPATTLADAARVLDETGIGQWPVVTDDGELIGKLTAADVAAALQQDATGQAPITSYVRTDIAPLALGSSPWEALALMLERRWRMLPVVDGGRVVGTLSTADFLRELSSGNGRLARDLVLEHIQRGSEVIDSDATLDQAQAAFDSGAKWLVVVQGDFPIGATTPLHVAVARVQQFARAQRGASSARRTLGQLLQSFPSIAPGRTLAEAATLLVEHGLDALAVASQAGQLSGVLTEEPVLQAMLAHEQARR